MLRTCCVALFSAGVLFSSTAKAQNSDSPGAPLSLIFPSLAEPSVQPAVRADQPGITTKERTDQVRRIQAWLVWEGLYPGPIDGEIGPGTSTAVKRFQKSLNAPQTGSLTPQQIETLKNRAEVKVRGVGFARVADGPTGVEIGMPLLTAPTRAMSKFGTNYVAKDGSVLIAIRAIHNDDPINVIFESYKTSFRDAHPEYSILRSNWFVIAGESNSVKFYIRFHQSGQQLAGFFAIYKSDIAETFAAPLAIISLTLQPFAAIPQLPIPASQKKALLEEANIIFHEKVDTDNTNPKSIAPPTAAPIPQPSDVGVVSNRQTLSNTDAAQAMSTLPSTAPVTVETRASHPAGGAEFSKLLLDSVEQLLKKANVKDVRFFKYIVDKKALDGFRDDTPVLRIVFPEKVFFDTDKAELRDETTPVIESVVKTIRERGSEGSICLFVAGHTDARGSDEHNLSLSFRRADSVARAVVARGPGAAAIWRVGFGKSLPLHPNDGPKNWAYNRRVEFLLASQQSVIAAWIKSTTTLCEGEKDCGGIAVSRGFIAEPLGRPELKPITLEVPARPSLARTESVMFERPPLPIDVPDRPSIFSQ